MNILLINPQLETWSPNRYMPLGLLYIASNLRERRRDITITVADLNISRLPRNLTDFDIVGITGTITELNSVKKLTALIRRSCSAKIVLGGALASSLPEMMMEYADTVVVGEGENVDLVTETGIVRGAPPTDIDKIPFPARDLIPYKKYTSNHFYTFGIPVRCKSTTMITSRGCPYRCTFCFKGLSGSKWRARTPENIIEEMDHLRNNYGYNGFIFNDDTFVLNRDRVIEFCKMVKQRCYFWYCNGRVNLMDEALLKTMGDSGCVGIAYGMESGNQPILDSIKKGITLEQISDAVRWTKEAGIHVTGYFILGLPAENKGTIEATLSFARKLNLDFYGFSLATPLPGTELYNTQIKDKSGDNLQSLEELSEWGSRVNANLTTDCTDSELLGYVNRSFKEFYLEKNYGRCYLLNPRLWIKQLMIMPRDLHGLKAVFRKAVSSLSS